MPVTFPTDWPGYDEIGFPNPTGALTDFPYLINLGKLSVTWWSNVKSDGGDAWVSDGNGVQLPCDLISFTSGSPGSGLIAVKFSPASSGTQKLRIYAGCPAATQPPANATYGQYNAYPSSLKAFYWNGGGNDRTSNANNLTMTGSPTVGGGSGLFNGSKSTDYNGSSQYGTATAAVPTAEPLTFLASVNLDGYASNSTIIGDSDTAGANEQWRLEILASNVVQATSRSGGSNGSGALGTTSTATNMRVGALFTNSASRQAILNGTLGTADTNSRAPSSIDTICVGANVRNTVANYVDGRISMAAIYTAALSSAWIAYDALMMKPASADQSDFYTFSGWTANTPPAPVCSVAPVVSGTKVVGQQLATTDGTWDSGSRSAIRWQSATDNTGSGAANIAGQTSSTLTTTESQAGKYVRSGVSFTSANGTTEAFSSWYGPIQVERYINPATGSDSNNGQSIAPWASLAQGLTYVTANPGIVNTLWIDTRTAPLYVNTLSGSNPFFTDAGLTIKSVDSANPADIRYWELLSGGTAVLYDTLYSTSGHPNVYVYTGKRADGAIWEFMGGRGDNLKWFKHLVECGITPSATYNNATNLSTLNSTPWSWWEGTDGSQRVLLFNPNGSPSGRQFATPFNPSQNTAGSCMEVSGVTLDGICFGGFSACASDGTTQAGSTLQYRNGANVKNCVVYGGCSHQGLAGAGAACTLQNNTFRELPSWMGTGGCSSLVWYSNDAATNPPTHTGDNITFIFSVAGQVRGSNFATGGTYGAANALGQAYYAHNINGNTNAITLTGCSLPGAINVKANATGCFTAVAAAGTYQSCTLLYGVFNSAPGSGQTSVINDSVILLNLDAANSSQFARFAGTATLQSCTIVAQNYMVSSNSIRPIFDMSADAGSLTINDCIFALTNNDGSAVVVTYGANLDTTDAYAANRNIFICSTSAVLHNSLTKSSSTSDRTLAQMQSLSYEASSVSDSNNSQTKLSSSNYHVTLATSLAIGKATDRGPAKDRSGATFPVRTTTGAYETVLADCVTQHLGITTGVGL